MPDELVFNRDMYRAIKSMNSEEMHRFFDGVYNRGKASAEHASEVDYDKIRSEISNVKGIGETRLEQIMDIIRKNV